MRITAPTPLPCTPVLEFFNVHTQHISLAPPAKIPSISPSLFSAPPLPPPNERKGKTSLI